MIYWWIQKYAAWLQHQYGVVIPVPETPPDEFSSKQTPPTDIERQPSPPPRQRKSKLRLVVNNSCIVFGLLISSVFTSVQAAQRTASPTCLTFKDLEVQMKQKLQVPLVVAVVEAKADHLVHYTLFVSPVTSNWTLVHVRNKTHACIVASGMFWEVIHPNNQEDTE